MNKKIFKQADHHRGLRFVNDVMTQWEFDVFDAVMEYRILKAHQRESLTPLEHAVKHVIDTAPMDMFMLRPYNDMIKNLRNLRPYADGTYVIEIGCGYLYCARHALSAYSKTLREGKELAQVSRIRERLALPRKKYVSAYGTPFID